MIENTFNTAANTKEKQRIYEINPPPTKSSVLNEVNQYHFHYQETKPGLRYLLNNFPSTKS